MRNPSLAFPRCPSARILIVAALAFVAGAATGQNDLRQKPLPSLQGRGGADQLRGDRRPVAEFVLAADLPPRSFDPDADIQRRRRPGAPTLAGHALGTALAKEIAGKPGCAAWLQAEIVAIGADSFVADVHGLELDIATLHRRAFALRAVTDASGRLRSAAYADSDLAAGELRELVAAEDRVQVISVQPGKPPLRVADVVGVATLPAILMCTLPSSRAATPMVVGNLDWRTGAANEEQWLRNDARWTSGAASIECEADGTPRQFVRGPGRTTMVRPTDAVDLLRQKVVAGGALRFGFFDAVTASLLRTKSGYRLPALGVEFELRGDWSRAYPVIEPFDTVLCVEEAKRGVLVRVGASPVDPETTLAVFTAPEPKVPLYGENRFPVGKPQHLEIRGFAALLERTTVNVQTVIVREQMLRFVADGVAYTVEVEAPEKEEDFGKTLLKTLIRSWKFE